MTDDRCYCTLSGPVSEEDLEVTPGSLVSALRVSGMK